MNCLKILIITLISIISINYAQANTNSKAKGRGTIVLGIGDLLMFNKYRGALYKNKEEEFLINPAISLNLQYLFFKKIAFGCNFYGHFKKAMANIYDQDYLVDDIVQLQTIFGGGPLVRTYFDTDKFIVPFLGFSYCYFREINQFYYENDYDYKGTDGYASNHHHFKASLGLDFMLTKSFGIYIAYNYIYNKRKVVKISTGNNSFISKKILKFTESETEKYKNGHIYQLNIGLLFFI